METRYFSDTCHAPRDVIRQFDGKYPVNGIATSTWAAFCLSLLRTSESEVSRWRF